MTAPEVQVTTTGGVLEDGLVVGNTYDKYGSKNPVVRRLMAGFEAALTELVAQAAPTSIHEVGCGEGYWVLRWTRAGIPARGSDVSAHVIALARKNAAGHGLPPALFQTTGILELEPSRDGADLLVCCEVLEHLESPEAGLRALQRTAGGHVLLSVPQEPLWRVLNLARGRYIRQGGNTPGHLQHWTRNGFLELVSEFFDVVKVRTPLPWTMVLCRSRR